MLKYTILRIGLFAGCFLALWAVWLRGLEGDFMMLVRSYPDQVFWGLVISAAASMVISFFWLRGLREQISQGINDRVNQRLSAKAAAEAATHPQRRSARVQDEADEDAEADGRG